MSSALEHCTLYALYKLTFAELCQLSQLPWLIGTAWTVLYHKHVAKLLKHFDRALKLSTDLSVFS